MGCDNYKVFVNTFKPRTDYIAHINDYTGSGPEKTKIIADTLNFLDAGKRVVVSCTSLKMAEALKRAADNRILANPEEHLIVKYYTGSDAKSDKLNPNKIGKKMALIKSDDFKDIKSAWAGCHLLIYTGTLSAGVSFEDLNFDVLIGIYSKGTGSPLGFT